MRVYVVVCRPVLESLTSAVLDTVLTTLAAGGHDVRCSDLVADGFRPELSAAEHAAHHRPPDDVAADAPDLAEYIDAVRWCDAIAFVYPTWWSGQPAVLTGWFDRVLANGVAWELPEGATRIRPLLRNVRRLVVVTTHGSSKLVNAAQGEGGKRVIRRSVRSVCHPLARTSWIAMYGVDRASADDRRAFLRTVERRVARL
ncbi:MAG: putative oxidoreductase [Ilumatobacteraceae bacterium]|nr:putative oxidoreductase [Ilumatobacteraceae bacterium]